MLGSGLASQLQGQRFDHKTVDGLAIVVYALNVHSVILGHIMSIGPGRGSASTATLISIM